MLLLDPMVFDPLETNLVDQIWTESNGRPPINKEPAFVYPIEYAGELVILF